jgi:glycerophosphoryl diester phosphodiesterase
MCCTSDFTLEQIKSLCGKMDSSGSINATTPEEYVYGGTPDWRTDLYQYGCPTIVSHKESIELIKSYGGKFTPELKGASVDMPYEGDFTQEAYAQKMIDEYIELGIDPKDVWPQSFNSSDVIYWIKNTEFGDQAVMLDETEYANETQFHDFFDMLEENGVKIIGPYLSQMVEQDDSAELGMKASAYSEAAKEHGFQMIGWSLERSGPGLEGWYWSSLVNTTRTDGDQLALLYVLTQEIGNVIAVFSDWPATTTFFGNCYELGLRESGGDSDGETNTTSPSSPAGTRRHLQVASQIVNFALKLVGI